MMGIKDFDTAEGVQAVSQDAEGAPAGACVVEGQSGAARAWECFRSPGEARAWLEAASERELREMEECLGRRGPVSAEAACSREQINLALCASEALWRRVIRSVSGGPQPQYRFRAPVSGRGNPS